jgi:hypothetical protein
LAVKDAADVTQVVHPTVPVVVIVPPVNGELNTMLVIVPVPGGAAHVPSPRQKVVAEAEVPLFKFVTGRLPETSVASATEAKVGAPAPPCSTVVALPKEPSTVSVCEPFPRTNWFAVKDEPVAQVGQDIVPVVVMGPPEMGEVVETRLTEPTPPGTAHVPSPRQKVVLDAEVPLFNLATGRFPVTPPLAVEARLMGKMSAATSARNVGATAAPVVGPAKTVLADCVDTEKFKTGVVDGVDTLKVAKGPRVPVALKLVIPPPPPLPGPITLQVFTPVHACKLPAVKSQIMGCCWPTVGGLQFGRGSGEVCTKVCLPLLPCPHTAGAKSKKMRNLRISFPR